LCIDHFRFILAEFFQKQGEEKLTHRISLTTVQTDEHLMKRLAPRTARLYQGWQPTDSGSFIHC
jgi:hypothetical protein